MPLSITHGEENSRVPVQVSEALRLWDIACGDMDVELMVCELGGHGAELDQPDTRGKLTHSASFCRLFGLGFKQKRVIVIEL